MIGFRFFTTNIVDFNLSVQLLLLCCLKNRHLFYFTYLFLFCLNNLFIIIVAIDVIIIISTIIIILPLSLSLLLFSIFSYAILYYLAYNVLKYCFIYTCVFINCHCLCKQGFAFYFYVCYVLCSLGCHLYV